MPVVQPHNFRRGLGEFGNATDPDVTAAIAAAGAAAKGWQALSFEDVPPPGVLVTQPPAPVPVPPSGVLVTPPTVERHAVTTLPVKVAQTARDY